MPPNSRRTWRHRPKKWRGVGGHATPIPMLRFALKLLLAGAALAAIWAFVPFGGRTLSDRWKTARTPSEFVARTWAEMKGPAAPPAKARPQARSAEPRERSGGRQPTEGHTEADRRALDRIVSDRLGAP